MTVMHSLAGIITITAPGHDIMMIGLAPDGAVGMAADSIAKTKCTNMPVGK